MMQYSTFWKLLLISLILLGGSQSALAGDPARVGTAGGAQTLVPIGARSVGMGGANLANTQGLEAMYWNPAGLAMSDYRSEAQVSTMQIFNDINVNFLGLSSSMGRLGRLGFQLKVFDVGDIPVTTLSDIDGLSGSTFSPVMLTTGLTYAKALTDVIQFGVTGKLIHESIPRASSSTVAFDIGLQYRELGGISGLALGVAVKNIGGDLQFSGSGLLRNGVDRGSLSEESRQIPIQSDNLPSTVELGLGYRRQIAENNSILFSGNFQNNNSGNDDYHFGLEYSYSDFVALRGGYLMSSNQDADDQLYTFSMGLGLRTEVSGTNLQFDYAFRDSQYFDGNNLFSLTLGF